MGKKGSYTPRATPVTARPASISPTPLAKIQTSMNLPSRSANAIRGKSQTPKTDYLAELRKKRHQFENMVIPKTERSEDNSGVSRSFENPQKLRNQADRLEKSAARYEVMLDYISNSNADKVSAAQKVNDMYLESIRAKIALLNSQADSDNRLSPL